MRQFLNVKAQIERLCLEFFGSSQITEGVTVNEDDLMLRKLDELQAQLQILQKEKICTYIPSIQQTKIESFPLRW